VLVAIYFITGSEDKYNEAKSVISDLERVEIDLPELQSINPHEVIKYKLEEAKKHKDGNLVVEDGSLYLDCLSGLPGPLIKWFMKTIGNDGLVKSATAFENDTAEAKVIIDYYKEGSAVEFFEGTIKGKIVAPRGENGFGWDPVFQPETSKKTFGEMSTGKLLMLLYYKVQTINRLPGE
jgi:inosine triphosphate pyrophosphatase